MSMRQIRIFGAAGTGKKTLVGNLMMSCGGPGMTIMERLQREGIQRYDRMTEFFIRENIPLSFETRSGPWEITESNDPDVVLFVVDASTSTSASTSTETNINIIDLRLNGDPDATIGIFERCTRLILIVNKMDTVNWSAESFQTIINRATSELQAENIKINKFNSVAVSALHGDNIIQRSGDPMWRTLVQTLDLGSIL
ncbi:hypothetical protein TWF506_008678 [Arthrobotrys conoides]|uniref:Uncharacterized protein n=1 Tax=Arthrobotrys conoides TaxID=74498 RepID=A0AAN8RXM3_9PEZI